MADYISRDDFAKHLADIQYGEAPTGRTGENIDYKNGVYAGFDMAYVALKQFPAADVRPVVKSRWIEIDDYVLCANCGVAEHSPNKNYCHNCGCAMENEK